MNNSTTQVPGRVSDGGSSSGGGGEIFHEILTFLEKINNFLNLDLFGEELTDDLRSKWEYERKELSEKSQFMLKLFNLARQEGNYVNMDSNNGVKNTRTSQIINKDDNDDNAEQEFEYTYCDFRDDNAAATSTELPIDSGQTCPYKSLTFPSLPTVKLVLHGELLINEKRLFHKTKLKTVHAVLIDNWLVMYGNDNKKPLDCVKVVEFKRLSNSDVNTFVVSSSATGTTKRTKEHEFHVATENEIENWMKALSEVTKRFNSRHSYVNVAKTNRELPGIPDLELGNVRKSAKSDDIYEEPAEMSDCERNFDEAVYDVVDNTIPPPVLPEKKLSMQTFKAPPPPSKINISDYDVPKNNKPVSPSTSTASKTSNTSTPKKTSETFKSSYEEGSTSKRVTTAMEVKTIELKLCETKETEIKESKPIRRRLFLEKSTEPPKHPPMEVKEISNPVQNHNEIKEKLLQKGIQLTPIKVSPEKPFHKTSPIKDFNRQTIKSWFSTKWSKIERKPGGESSKDLNDLSPKDTNKVNLIIHQMEVNKHLEQVLKIRNKRNTIACDENE